MNDEEQCEDEDIEQCKDEDEEQCKEFSSKLDMPEMKSGLQKEEKKSVVTWKEGNLLEIVKSQKYVGNWEFNEDNARIAKQTTTELSSTIPEDLKN